MILFMYCKQIIIELFCTSEKKNIVKLSKPTHSLYVVFVSYFGTTLNFKLIIVFKQTKENCTRDKNIRMFELKIINNCEFFFVSMTRFITCMSSAVSRHLSSSASEVQVFSQKGYFCIVTEKFRVHYFSKKTLRYGCTTFPISSALRCPHVSTAVFRAFLSPLLWIWISFVAPLLYMSVNACLFPQMSGGVKTVVLTLEYCEALGRIPSQCSPPAFREGNQRLYTLRLYIKLVSSHR